ncbi:HD domain-containing protein [Runella zeae]|uniref:HD domain-containing protein n=1 Tax=Runella zeae TaxID=94255 RepID=UPI002356F88D|nr:ATP-binding protein [Runella zeae]
MASLIKMYTLENHLKNSCIENSTYEILNSIWHLNKKNLPNAQNAITFNFPHYSLHEKSHSDTILKNIESFLGEERIRQLSPTDTWLILMSAHTHDLGMVVYHNVLEKKWGEPEFQEFLSNLSETSNDKDLKKSASILVNLPDYSVNDIKKTLPLEIRKAVTLITAEYFRRNHHFRSKEMLLGHENDFYQHSQQFNLGSIPNRFSEILAEIAYAHGIGFYETLDRLEYIANGLGSDKMHPRFIACLLRLGDLLDVDDNRFDIYSEKVLGELPHLSKLHKEKHASVKHLLISPSSIEVTVDCKSDEVYRVTRQWFDWLQIEVENQSKEWSSIVPRNLSGFPPTISKGKIKVLYKSTKPLREELMELKFTISNKKIFEILEGGGIYEKKEFIFLREIIQNALDATKVQIWKSISLGVYNFAIADRVRKDKNSTTEDLIKLIKFPSDFPDYIYLNYPINLTIDWKDEKKEVLQIVIRDRGTGISDEDLIRMVRKVGESKLKEKNYRDFIHSMPYWLKPTGAFGIGIQSVFLVADTFTIHTRTENEPAKEILFFSSKNDDYCRITSEVPDIPRGTVLYINIPVSNFDKIFSTTFEMDIVDKFDVFDSFYGNEYLLKIEKYLKLEFYKVNNISIEMFNNKINGYKEKKGHEGTEIKEFFSKEGNLKGRLDETQSSFRGTWYVIDESILGSEIIVELKREFWGYSGVPYYQNDERYIDSSYLVRDIPVNERFPGYYYFQYLNIIWNLKSSESDKILSLSRDRLIPYEKRKFNEMLIKDIFPKALGLINEMFEDRMDESNDLAAEYFHLQLTNKMFKISGIERCHTKYKTEKIPNFIATDCDMEEVDFEVFFSDVKFILTNIKIEDRSKNISEVKSIISETIGSDSSKFIVVWHQEGLRPYLHTVGYCTEKILHTSKPNLGNVNVRIMSLNNNTFIEVNDDYRKKYFQSLNTRFKSERKTNRRTTLLALEPFAKSLAVNTYFDMFHYREEDGVNYIISPFNKSHYNDLSHRLQSVSEPKERESIIRDMVTSNLVPSSLIEFIIKNSANPDGVTESEIIQAYTSLIVELLDNNEV